MRISARVENRLNSHTAAVETDGRAQSIGIQPRPGGFGSSVNGGELLFLALATCYCNDIYREAGLRGITVRGVQVEVEGSFGGPGEPAREIRYRASVDADAPVDVVQELIRHTDTVAEIQNTLRAGIDVRLVD